MSDTPELSVDEILDWVRFEQEWVALEVMKDVLLTYVLNESAKSQLELLLKQEMKKLVPKKLSMKPAIQTHSDAGAGTVIGTNSCIDQINEAIER